MGAGLDFFADGLRVPFRQLLEEALQQVLEGQMTDFLGAAPGKRNRTRSGHRDGHRDRRLVTSLGELQLGVPRDRARQFSSELFDRYPRVEQAVLSSLASLHLQGVSIARVNGLIEALGGRALSAAATAQVVAGVHAALARFAERRIETGIARVILEARRARIRLDGVVRPRTILLATGVDAAGRHELLAVGLAGAGAAVHGMLRRLRRRGLRGVELTVCVDRKDLRLPVAATLGLRSASRVRPAHRRGPAALDTSSVAWQTLPGPAAVASLVPGASSQGSGPQIVIERTEAAQVAPWPSGAEQPIVPGSPAPGPAFSAGLADRAAACLQAEPSVVWVRRGVEQELGAKRPRPSARSPSRFPWKVAGSSAGLVALAAGAWVLLHVVGTPQPRTSAALASAAYEEPRPAFFTTTNPAAPSARPGMQAVPSALRLRLTGVIAAKSLDGTGIALIAVGDAPPNPFRVGALVGQDLAVKAVKLDRVQLGPLDGPATLELELNATGPIVAALGAPPPALGGAERTPLASDEPTASGIIPPIGAAPPVSAPAGVSGGTVVADASGAKAVVDPMELVRPADYRDDASRASARRAHMFRRTAAR